MSKHGRYPALQETIQNPAAGAIERKTVADQKVNAMTIGYQQGGRAQAANTLLSLEDK